MAADHKDNQSGLTDLASILPLTDRQIDLLELQCELMSAGEGKLALLVLHPVLCVLTVHWPSYDQHSLRVGSLTERRSHAWSSVRRSDLGWRKLSLSAELVFFFPFCCPTRAHAEQCPCEKWMLDWKQKQHPLPVTSTAKRLQQQFPLLALKGSISDEPLQKRQFHFQFFLLCSCFWLI